MTRIIEIYETNIYAIIYFGSMFLFILTILISREFKTYRKNERIRHRAHRIASAKTQRTQKVSETETKTQYV